MAIGLALALFATVTAGIALFIVSRSRPDERRDAVVARLKALTAPSQSVILKPDLDEVSPDPWLRHLPEKWQPRIDHMLGATGYQVSLRGLLMLGCGSALVVAIVFGYLLGVSAMVVAAIAVVAGLGIPFQALKVTKARHTTKFLQRFPDAIDLIVRAVRAGLPVQASMEVAGAETPDPVGSEFRRVIADTRIGITVEEALARAGKRIGLVEFNFFVASIQLQRESGGNLTETLATLSSVLRRRDEIRAKTRALTAEARLSAIVLAAMPFVTAGAIVIISPHYFAPMFQDPRGGYILGAALLSIAIAVFTMRTMLRKITA
jgi:tight adherence protein B